jgi:leucyl/phenylalanyl-tRNA---protein transferase
MIPWLDTDDPFPPVDAALREPNGLLAAGADLSPRRLLAAYARGIFPWFNDDDPTLWWSPDPRMVLYLDELHVTRSLRRVIRSERFEVRADTAFLEVMAACAEPRAGQDGTWITSAMLEAYGTLATLGFAHSIESWADGQLAGGLYGVALGRMFYGESMFTRQSDASKVAFAHLVAQLRRWGFRLIDCQMSTAHLASLGGRDIRRQQFVREISELIGLPPVPGPWSLDAGLAQTL